MGSIVILTILVLPIHGHGNLKKALLRGKFVTLQSYLIKQEKERGQDGGRVGASGSLFTYALGIHLQTQKIS